MQQPLIDVVAGLLERTYDIDCSVIPLGRFVVGDAGVGRLLRQRAVRERIDHDGQGARLLLREVAEGPGWGAALYLPNALIDHLERHDPRAALGVQNIDAFATLIEEIDHLVTFSDRVCRHGGEISLLELEWHAVLSQYLVLSHFAARLAGSSELSASQRTFLDEHLFHKRHYIADDVDLRERYREALRRGQQTIASWRRQPLDNRLRWLRLFHRASVQGKLALVA